MPPVQISEIKVFDCCGIFGWLIPWHEWKARIAPLVALVPTRNITEAEIYLYSRLGQIGRPDLVERVTPSNNDIQSYESINIDTYFSPGTMQVNWPGLSAEIEVRALQARKREEKMLCKSSSPESEPGGTP